MPLSYRIRIKEKPYLTQSKGLALSREPVSQ